MFARSLDEREEKLLQAAGITKKLSLYDAVMEELDREKGRWYDSKKAWEDAASGDAQDFSYDYPAVKSMIEACGGEPDAEQRRALDKMKQQLAALYQNGEPTQAEVDALLAKTCTKLLNKGARDQLEMYARDYIDGKWQLNPDKPQERVMAYTDQIDNLFEVVDAWAQKYYKEFEHAKRYFNLNAMLYTTAKKAFDFANRVRENGVWDMKYHRSWDDVVPDEIQSTTEFSSSHRFVYNGELINAQELGNMLYGYAGSEIGFSANTLYRAGGVVHILTDGADPIFTAPHYGDSAEDHIFIQKGIELYYSTLEERYGKYE